MNAGYYEEAQAWRDWLLRAAAGRPDQLQIMYGSPAKRRLTEWERRLAAGLRKRRSRCASAIAAHGQLQLDVYGEVMDALYQGAAAACRRTTKAGPCKARCSRISRILGRAGPRHLGVARRAAALHLPKVMAWVAFDRAVRNRIEEFGLDGRVDDWRAS